MSTTEPGERLSGMTGREARVFSAPGRVNLIGEHTDYNDGFVLPMALDLRTQVAGVRRDDAVVRCRSTRFPGTIEFRLDEPISRTGDWGDLVRGIAACLLRDEYQLHGAELLIESDVPVGAGLSSSAAVEVASGYALLKLAGEPIDPVDLALAAQRAEQEFAGTQCGIMDQYVAALGIAKHALLIDCRSLEYRAVPMDLDGARVVVCNSMVRHELASGEYNQRRAECEEGVRRLSGYLPEITALRDVGIEEFDLYGASLPPTILRRCNHVITENARTLEAVTALERQDLATFGRLMFASHASLRDDYQVSCPELDLLVELASGCEGVYGARMTGGGFGGATVNLVRDDAVPAFIDSISSAYRDRTGTLPECFVCLPGEGARED